MKTDFSSPFMYAAILKNPGLEGEKRFPLSVSSAQVNPQPVELTGTTAGEKNGDPLFASTLSYLSSVTVSIDLGGIPTIDVVLTPTLEDARKILDSTLLEYPINAIEVILGYSTGTGPSKNIPFQGILQPPEVTFGADVTITLKGIGTAGYYLAATSASGTEVRQTRQTHIIKLVEKMGANVSTNVDDWLLDEDSYFGLQEVVPLVNSGKSYLHIISQLARAAGCWVNTFNAEAGFSVLNIVSQARMVAQEPLALFTLYDFSVRGFGSSIADKSIYPILSISVGEGLSAIFLSGWAKALQLKKINQTTQESSENTTGPKDAKVTGGDDSQTGVDNDSNKQSKTTAPVPDDDTPLEKSALDQLAGMTSLSNSVGLQLEIETIGVPEVFPGEMYQVNIGSKRIDGKYICHALKHSMSASGFTTSLTLIQNSQLMVQAILDKISPKAVNETAPISSGSGTESQLQMLDPIVVIPRDVGIA